MVIKIKPWSFLKHHITIYCSKMSFPRYWKKIGGLGPEVHPFFDDSIRCLEEQKEVTGLEETSPAFLEQPRHTNHNDEVGNVKVKVESEELGDDDDDEEEDSDVEMVGAHFVDLSSVVCLDKVDICRCLSRSPRPLGRYVTFVTVSHLPGEQELYPGNGFFLDWEGDDWRHSVALWRGLDGDYFYFDSLNHSPPSELLQYLLFFGCTKIYKMKSAVQFPEIGTCTFHCFAFFDFVTKFSYLSTEDLPDYYPRNKTYDHDVQVVKIFESMLSEFDSNFRLRTRRPWTEPDWLVQDMLSANTIASRVKQRHRKRSSVAHDTHTLEPARKITKPANQSVISNPQINQ